MRPVALFCLVFFTSAVRAAAFPAHVLRCHDGDTCTVLTRQGVVKVRLAQVDAPEIDQPYGTQVRDVLCALICDRDVDIEPRGTSYDRVVGSIRLGGLDTSEAMVREWATWDYARYDSDPVMTGLKATALQRGRGSWAAPLSIVPWNLRDSVKLK